MYKDKRRGATGWAEMERAIVELMEADRLKSHVIDTLYTIILQQGGAELLDRELYEEMQEAAILSRDCE